MVAQHPCVHRRGNLGRAGGLRSVADHAGNGGQSVDQGVGHLPASPAVEIGNGTSGSAPGADRAAVGTQPSDSSLHVDGQQIAECHSADQLFLTHPQLPGIHHHGDGGGEALVAAAGNNDDRHLTSAHPRVGPRGGHIPGPDLHVLAIVLPQHLADIGPPVPGHALLGDSPVVGNLPLHDLPDVFRIHCIRKIHNGIHREASSIC